MPTAQNIYLSPWIQKRSLKLVRPVIVDGPLVSSADRFLVIGHALDMSRHRVRLTLEQVIFDPSVVVGLIIDERWDLELLTPTRTVIDERWDMVLEDVAQFHEELWES